MINYGVEFSRTRDCSHLDEDNLSLKKPFSIYFLLDMPYTHYNATHGLLGLGVDYDDILSIQRRLGEAENIAVSAWDVTIAGK